MPSGATRSGKLESIGAPHQALPGSARESWMHIEIDRLLDAEQRDALAAGIERVLADVRAAVTDWKAMLARLHDAIEELRRAPTTVPHANVAESRAFLQWLADDHMTLLGYRQHDLVDEQGETALQLVPGSGLGVLRETAAGKTLGQLCRAAAAGARDGAGATAGARGHQGEYPLDRAPVGLHRLHRRQALQRARRSDRRTPVHRPVHLHRL